MAGEGRPLPDGGLGMASVKKARSRLVAPTFCELGSAARRLPLRSRVAQDAQIHLGHLRFQCRSCCCVKRWIRVVSTDTGRVSKIVEHSQTSGCRERQAELWWRCKRADKCRSDSRAFYCAGVRAPKGVPTENEHDGRTAVLAGGVGDGRGMAGTVGGWGGRDRTVAARPCGSGRPGGLGGRK